MPTHDWQFLVPALMVLNPPVAGVRIPVREVHSGIRAVAVRVTGAVRIPVAA